MFSYIKRSNSHLVGCVIFGIWRLCPIATALWRQSNVSLRTLRTLMTRMAFERHQGHSMHWITLKQVSLALVLLFSLLFITFQPPGGIFYPWCPQLTGVPSALKIQYACCVQENFRLEPPGSHISTPLLSIALVHCESVCMVDCERCNLIIFC